MREIPGLQELPEGIQLYVRPLMGETFSLEVATTATIAEVKLEIARLWRAFKPEMSRVIWQGSELLEHKRCVDIGLVDGDVLEVPYW